MPASARKSPGNQFSVVQVTLDEFDGRQDFDEPRIVIQE